MNVRLGIVVIALLCMSPAYGSSIAATANLEPHADGTALHVSVPLAKTLDLRVGFNTYLAKGTYTIPGALNTQITDMAFDVKRKVDNYDILLDWFPYNNYFRLTGGVIISSVTTITLSSPQWHDNYQHGSNASSKLVSNVRSATMTAPYIGIGLGLPAGRSYKRGLSIDIGILFQRPAPITFDQSYCTTTYAECQQLVSTVSNQKQQINHHFDRHRYFMARVGLTYRF